MRHKVTKVRYEITLCNIKSNYKKSKAATARYELILRDIKVIIVRYKVAYIVVTFPERDILKEI